MRDETNRVETGVKDVTLNEAASIPNQEISPEKLEEQKLMNKYPGGLKKAPSSFAQKRLQHGQRKFFDSGDYNMAKAKGQMKINPMARPPMGAANTGGGGNPQIVGSDATKTTTSDVVTAGGRADMVDSQQQKRVSVDMNNSNSSSAILLGNMIDRNTAASIVGGGQDDSEDERSPTGNAIPTPETVPLRKSSIIHSMSDKLSPQPLINTSGGGHQGSGNNNLYGSGLPSSPTNKLQPHHQQSVEKNENANNV